MLEIYKRTQSIFGSSKQWDIELSRDSYALSEEIKKRGLSQENKPQEISNYEGSSFTKKEETGGTAKGGCATPVIAIIVIALIFIATIVIISNTEKEGGNKATVTESTDSLKAKQEAAEKEWKESVRVFFSKNPEYLNDKEKNLAFVEAVKRLVATEESNKMTDEQVLNTAKKECDAIFYPTGRPKTGGDKVDGPVKSRLAVFIKNTDTVSKYLYLETVLDKKA